MPLSPVNGVRWAWLLDPITRTLEVFVLRADRWQEPTVYQDAARVRAVPFDAIELDLSVLWGE